MCEVCLNFPYFTCGKAALKTDVKRPMMILPVCSQSASAVSGLSKRKLWYNESDCDSADSDTSKPLSFSDEHDVDSDDDNNAKNDLEEVQYDNTKSEIWVLVFYEEL